MWLVYGILINVDSLYLFLLLSLITKLLILDMFMSNCCYSSKLGSMLSSHILFCRIHYKSRMRSLLPQLIVSLLARQEGRCRWSWDFTAEPRTQSRIGGLNYFSWYYTRCLHVLYLSIWIVDVTLTLFFVTPL